MGKSNKKVKNDRINTLRKQYDAYLEEDKKRKERNEFILGKLDKMRSSSALVPILSKASYHQGDLSDIYMRSGNLRKTTNPIYDNYVSHLEPQNDTSGILNKHVDESSILKEISKRYILIPRRRMPMERVEYAYNKETINDNDWRSKYNILENLKQQEKEGHSDIPTNENNETLNRSFIDPDVNYDKQPSMLDNGPNQASPETTLNKLNTYHENKINKTVDFEIPEKCQINDNNIMPIQNFSVSTNDDLKSDNSKELLNVETTNIPVAHENNQPHQECIEEKEKYYSDVNEKHLGYEQNQNIHNDINIIEGNDNNQKDYPENTYIANQNQLMPESNKYEGYDNVNCTSYSGDVPSDVTLQETTVSEIVLNPSENTDIQKDAIKTSQELVYSDPVQLHADIDKCHGDQLEADHTIYETPKDYDPAQDNPIALENTEQTEHVDHDSEINAFETEQKEMFYSEQTGGDAYAYNQGDGNTGEYPAEGYVQNDQYPYFEGAQQEQGYATNVNEHEEATERYDPHFNQQYEGTYENQQPDNTNYENANTYEQQQYQEGIYDNQQFENVVNYENQQEMPNLYQQENVANENEVQESVLVPENTEGYDQHLYAGHSETQEHIEQQLVSEEGYIENPPITAESKPEHEGEIEGVMDITNPIEQIPEPKLS